MLKFISLIGFIASLTAHADSSYEIVEIVSVSKCTPHETVNTLDWGTAIVAGIAPVGDDRGSYKNYKIIVEKCIYNKITERKKLRREPVIVDLDWNDDDDRDDVQEVVDTRCREEQEALAYEIVPNHHCQDLVKR